MMTADEYIKNIYNQSQKHENDIYLITLHNGVMSSICISALEMSMSVNPRELITAEVFASIERCKRYEKDKMSR
jgi:hypothetical protein